MERKLMWVLKALLASYVVTTVLLIVMAFFLYKFDLKEGAVSAGIVGIYVISTLTGGILIGKMARMRRFLWGLSIGVLYFVLLLLITVGVYHSLSADKINVLTTLILCAGGGMIGGMIS